MIIFPDDAPKLAWLRGQGEFEFVQQDIHDFDSLQKVLAQHADADVMLHLAAQVAVTTSASNPREDFEINALGTFNLLEAVRIERRKCCLLV